LDFDGTYVIDGAARVHLPPAELVPWLVTPELMRRWMIGTASIDALADEPGSSVLVKGSHGVYAGWTFAGELLEAGERRVVRRYRLEGMRGGVLPMPVDGREYERVVEYDLRPGDGAATDLTCSVTTSIPGLSRAAAKAGGKDERKSLGRSLERLRGSAEGEKLGLLARWWGSSGASPQPL
jgi:hypothetical protein